MKHFFHLKASPTRHPISHFLKYTIPNRKKTTKYQHKDFLSPPQSFNFLSEHQFSIINTHQCRLSIFGSFKKYSRRKPHRAHPGLSWSNEACLCPSYWGDTYSHLWHVSGIWTGGRHPDQDPHLWLLLLVTRGQQESSENQLSLNDSDRTTCQQLLVKTSYLSLSCYVTEAGTWEILPFTKTKAAVSVGGAPRAESLPHVGGLEIL